MPIPLTSPMLATLTDGPFDSEDFVFEIKFDGYRALANVRKGEVKLYSRNLLSFNQKFPSIIELLEDIKEEVLLDGEVIAYDKKGVSSFELLQNQGEGGVLEYVVFDILYFKGKSVMHLPLLERKEILEKLLQKYPRLTYSSHIETTGIAFFNKAKKANLEGIIAKRKDGAYVPGLRSDSWLKIKNVKTDEAVIVGFTEPRGGRKFFGALVLAQRKGNDLAFIGHTGTGFSHTGLRDLHKELLPLVTKKSPFKHKIPINAPITWVKPKVVVGVKFTEWTKDGVMRHPVFTGVRPDKSPLQVKKEKVIPKKKAIAKKRT